MQVDYLELVGATQRAVEHVRSPLWTRGSWGDSRPDSHRCGMGALAFELTGDTRGLAAGGVAAGVNATALLWAVGQVIHDEFPQVVKHYAAGALRCGTYVNDTLGREAMILLLERTITVLQACHRAREAGEATPLTVPHPSLPPLPPPTPDTAILIQVVNAARKARSVVVSG